MILNESGRERNPTTEELALGLNEFAQRNRAFRPDRIVFFGSTIAEAIKRRVRHKVRKYETYDFAYLAYAVCDHPSYISIYRRRTLPEYALKIRELVIA